jgi:hypothetical protein
MELRMPRNPFDLNPFARNFFFARRNASEVEKFENTKKAIGSVVNQYFRTRCGPVIARWWDRLPRSDKEDWTMQALSDYWVVLQQLGIKSLEDTAQKAVIEKRMTDEVFEEQLPPDRYGFVDVRRISILKRLRQKAERETLEFSEQAPPTRTTMEGSLIPSSDVLETLEPAEEIGWATGSMLTLDDILQAATSEKRVNIENVLLDWAKGKTDVGPVDLEYWSAHYPDYTADQIRKLLHVQRLSYARLLLMHMGEDDPSLNLQGMFRDPRDRFAVFERTIFIPQRKLSGRARDAARQSQLDPFANIYRQKKLKVKESLHNLLLEEGYHLTQAKGGDAGMIRLDRMTEGSCPRCWASLYPSSKIPYLYRGEPLVVGPKQIRTIRTRGKDSARIEYKELPAQRIFQALKPSPVNEFCPEHQCPTCLIIADAQNTSPAEIQREVDDALIHLRDYEHMLSR